MSHLTQEQIRRLKQRLMERKAELESRMVHNDQHGMGNPNEITPVNYHISTTTRATWRPRFMNARRIWPCRTGWTWNCSVSFSPWKRSITGAMAHASSAGSDPVRASGGCSDTQYCLKDNPRQNPSHDRPVEEEFLHPPFGRSSLDEHEYSGFDGEDAWQIVESWGNSNSPALAEGNNIDSYNEMDIEHEDDQGGFVEVYENFVATNIDGTDVFFVRSPQYVEYIQRGEGSFLLDPNVPGEDDDDTLI